MSLKNRCRLPGAGKIPCYSLAPSRFGQFSRREAKQAQQASTGNHASLPPGNQK